MLAWTVNFTKGIASILVSDDWPFNSEARTGLAYLEMDDTSHAMQA